MPKPKKGERPLTQKQRRFVEAYLKNGRNAAEAYRTAYNSKASAKVCAIEASRLLKHPGIALIVAQAEERARKATDRAADRYALDAKRAAEILACQSAYDPRSFIVLDKGKERLKRLEELTDEEAFVITNVRMTEHGVVYDLPERRFPLMDWAKLRGEIVDRKEISGVGGAPIQTEEVGAFGREILEQRFLEISRRREQAKAGGAKS